MTTTDIIAAVRLVLTVEEAAERLGIGRTLMYSLDRIGRGRVGADRPATSCPADALERYVPGLGGDGRLDQSGA